MPNPKLETYKNKATGTVYDYTDADAQGKLSAILDGTDIDSFSDVESALADKVDVVSGKGLSTNDYDDTEKAKVAGAFPRSEQAVLGAKNLCPVISIGGRDSGSTLTYTVDTKDNTVEVDGTAATAGWAVLANTTKMISVLSQLAGKTIKFSGGLNNAKHLILRLKETSSSSDIDYVSRGSDVDVPVPSNIENYNRIEILLSINVNTVCSNDILKPMLSFDGGTYAPPAMTNRELTEKVQPLGSLSAVVDTGTVSVPTSTDTEVASISVSKGKYLLIGKISIGTTSAQHEVAICISSSNAWSSDRKDAITGYTSNLKSGGLEIVKYADVSSDTTYKLFATHNKGSNLDVYPLLEAIRIG